MLEIELSPHEMVTAGTVGLRRNVAAIVRRLKPVHGGQANGLPGAFGHHVVGAMAEFVVAKTLNLFWDPNIGKTRECDVGGIVEVRARTQDGDGLDLAIRPKDKPDAPHVLVHCDPPFFRIPGWIFAREARSITGVCWNEKRGLWFVPYGQLRPIESFTKTLADWR